MAKLHEVLAVEGGLAGTAQKIREEAIVTFSKRADHFIETATEQTYFAEEDRNQDTKEAKAMVTTVAQKLEYVAPIISRYWDAYLQKEATNQTAKADVVLDGDKETKPLLADMPATVLLGLETKLKEVRALYEAIPTLAPGPHWERDLEKGPGVYRSRDPDQRFITKKTIRPVVMSPATKEHPAQVQAISEDITVAKKVVTTWSGMLSPGEKSDLLERIDLVIRAVKKARQRANNVEAVNRTPVGKIIFDFIHAGII